ncbi:MAG: hypothetical protein HRT57_07490 [Crocinitomicaceae bacterium]|nr:hypothetical protein [Crocinitomicaceae bacterium]
MQSFNQFLTEDATKNLHLEHLEDLVFLYGIDGVRSGINFLRSIRDMLSGTAKKKVDLHVKWDGAPAIFAGTDPEDGKFFVGTKGVFAKNAKLIKSNADLKKHGYSGGLAEKLKVALKELPKLGINGVIQGDMMFTKGDLSDQTIDGVNYITFQPNTIVYAVESQSDFAKKIKAAKLGVVWHTTYTGETLPEMSASIGVNISGLKKTKNVWFDNANYHDVSGNILFTPKEIAELDRYLARAGKSFRKIKSRDLNLFMDMQNKIPSVAVASSLKTFNNTKVRAGEAISNPRGHAVEYLKYFETWWDTHISALKTQKTKDVKERIKQEHLKVYRRVKPTLIATVEYQTHVVNAKNVIVRKLGSGANRYRTFVKTNKGFRVTGDEGFVAVDKAGKIVKLVDRLEFSHQNFTAIKNWDS